MPVGHRTEVTRVHMPSQERTLPTQELPPREAAEGDAGLWRDMETVAFLSPFFHWAGLAGPGKVFWNQMDVRLSGRWLVQTRESQ